MSTVDLLDGKRLAFVQATWHREVVDQGHDGFVARISELGIESDRIDRFEVPGSLEIPLQAQLLCRTGDYAAIVACGLIVDGGIYRHEFVAATVLDAMMRVQLESDVPVLSVVLTPQRFHEHDEHLNFFRDHLKVKGAEAADACVQTLRNMQELRGMLS